MHDLPDPAHIAALAQKILAVMRQVDRLPKDAKNSEFNYKFVSEPTAIDAVRKACVEHGLVILPSVLSVSQEPTGATTRGGSPMYRARVTMQYELMDSETGYVRTSTWSGECIEAQDKGINKAITSAGKYFLLKTFMIPTGDDPDAGRPAEAREATKATNGALSPKQVHASFGLTAEQDAQLKAAVAARGEKYSAWIMAAHAAGDRTADDLMARLGLGDPPPADRIAG